MAEAEVEDLAGFDLTGPDEVDQFRQEASQGGWAAVPLRSWVANGPRLKNAGRRARPGDLRRLGPDSKVVIL